MRNADQDLAQVDQVEHSRSGMRISTRGEEGLRAATDRHNMLRPGALEGAELGVGHHNILCFAEASASSRTTTSGEKGEAAEPGPAAVKRLVVLGLSSLLLEGEDAGVGQVGDLGQDQEVVAAEAGSGFPFVAILVETGKGGVVSDSDLCFVLPDSGFDSADPNFNGSWWIWHFEISFWVLSVFAHPGRVKTIEAREGEPQP